MTTTLFTQQIRQLIADDLLPLALEKMRLFAEKTPLLNEVLQQSGRLAHIRQQNNLGLVTHNEATLEQNRIRYGLLELLNDLERNGTPPQPFDALLAAVEQESARPEVQAEVAQAISIVNSKNVVVGATISAGGNVHIGDVTTVTESQTSRRLRLFLYLFVPFLALGGAFLWYLMQPLTLTVAVDNRTPNLELPFKKGEITLQTAGRSETKTLETETEAVFTKIPRGEKINLRFESPGFVKIDTAFVPDGERLVLPIRRDASLARIFGTVKDGRGNPLAGAQIQVQDMVSVSGNDGAFSIAVPFGKQREKQRITAVLGGFAPSDYLTQIVENEGIPIILQKK